MIELDEIDTKPIFDSIVVETGSTEGEKAVASSCGDRKEFSDGSKKKRKSVPRKNVARDLQGGDDKKDEEESESVTWQGRRDEDEEDEDEGGASGGDAVNVEDNKTEASGHQGNYIELLSVKEYLFDKNEDNEDEKFNSTNFPFSGVMYNQGSNTNQSMQFLSFASESTNCSLGTSVANREGSDGRADGDESVDKDLSTTDDDYDYDENNLDDDKSMHLS